MQLKLFDDVVLHVPPFLHGADKHTFSFVDVDVLVVNLVVVGGVVSFVVVLVIVVVVFVVCLDVVVFKVEDKVVKAINENKSIYCKENMLF
jgi:hypothetical protein